MNDELLALKISGRAIKKGLARIANAPDSEPANETVNAVVEILQAANRKLEKMEGR